MVKQKYETKPTYRVSLEKHFGWKQGLPPLWGDSPSAILRQCIHLQLLNTGLQECFMGTVALSCSKLPLGRVDWPTKVFGTK